mgnify:CR=1 FL=1
MVEAVRVFIGSGEASLLERKVLIYSLKKHSTRPLDISVFNGTHDALEKDGEAPLLLGMPMDVKYRNVTEFSNYRFLIPRLCNYTGRAIWLDSDTVCLADISELFESEMNGCSAMAKRDAYGNSGEERWGLSVSLYDCAQCTFTVEECFNDVQDGRYSYSDLHQFSPRFRSIRPIKVGAIDPNWNVFDRYDEKTKLIHYTNLLTQPWKYRGHPFGDIWFQYFSEARQEGFITDEDVELTVVRSYARTDLAAGNDSTLRQITRDFLLETRNLLRNRLRHFLR